MTREELNKTLNEAGGNFSGIYRITSKLTGKKYDGKARCITSRINQHIDSHDKSLDGIDAAIRKDGWENFIYEVVEALPEANDDLLFFREAYWIGKDEANNSAVGYNKTAGNYKHCEKVYRDIKKYNAKHIVYKDLLKEVQKQIPDFFDRNLYTLIHEFGPKIKDRLIWNSDVAIKKIISENFTAYDNKGNLVEDTKKLGEYIKGELNTMIENKDTNAGNIISNPPYGMPEITLKALELDFDTYINLEPGNDYFTKEKLYKHLDPSFTPVILRNGCFKDASQVTVIAKLQKEENNLSEIEARILLHIDTRGNEELKLALKEYLLKVNALGALSFCISKLTRRHTFVQYDPTLFMFNSGSFDIAHGNFAVITKDRINWTDATSYNVFKKEFTTGSDVPASKVTGCNKFKKIIYSITGLSWLRVMFDSSPEGWGLTGMFANIDYTGINTIADYFNVIGLSSKSQTVLFAAISEVTLTDKEKEICKIVEAM